MNDGQISWHPITGVRLIDGFNNSLWQSGLVFVFYNYGADWSTSHDTGVSLCNLKGLHRQPASFSYLYVNWAIQPGTVLVWTMGKNACTKNRSITSRFQLEHGSQLASHHKTILELYKNEMNKNNRATNVNIRSTKSRNIGKQEKRVVSYRRLNEWILVGFLLYFFIMEVA